MYDTFGSYLPNIDGLLSLRSTKTFQKFKVQILLKKFKAPKDYFDFKKLFNFQRYVLFKLLNFKVKTNGKGCGQRPESHVNLIIVYSTSRNKKIF